MPSRTRSRSGAEATTPMTAYSVSLRSATRSISGLRSMANGGTPRGHARWLIPRPTHPSSTHQRRVGFADGRRCRRRRIGTHVGGPWLRHCSPSAVTARHPRSGEIRARRPRNQPSSHTGAVRTVYLGTSPFAAHVLERLAEGRHRPVLVVTRPDRPAGRGRTLTPPPVADTARAVGIDLDQPEDVNAPDARARIAGAEPDVLLVCAFGALIREPLLSEFELLNVHP